MWIGFSFNVEWVMRIKYEWYETVISSLLYDCCVTVSKNVASHQLSFESYKHIATPVSSWLKYFELKSAMCWFVCCVEWNKFSGTLSKWTWSKEGVLNLIFIHRCLRYEVYCMVALSTFFTSCENSFVWPERRNIFWYVENYQMQQKICSFVA